jgi:outer membrane protein assembly factor BamB
MNPDGSVWISQGAGGFVMTGDDAIWAIFDNGSTRDIVRIDPATNEMETALSVPRLPNPITAVGVGDFVWVASWDRGSVTQYDEQTGEEIAEHPVGTHPVEPIYAYGDIWTTAIHSNQVARIDAETADVELLEMDPSGEPIGMTMVRDDRALIGNAGKSPYVINPQTMAVLGVFDPHVASGCWPRIAAIEGQLWMDNCTLDDPLVIVDLDTGEELGEVDSPVTADAPLFVDDLMWMPREINNELGHRDGQNWVGIDHVTHELVAEYAAASRFTEDGYAVGFDSLWMFGHEGILRIPADTLRDARTE